MERETLEKFRQRTEYVWRGMEGFGGFSTAGGLGKKVNPDGTLRPFYGDTVIFDLEETDKAWLSGLQRELYDVCGYCLAERLDPASFHLTLHDLMNGEDKEALRSRMEKTGTAARAVLQSVRAQNPDRVALRSMAALNMVGTSVVLAFEPVSEADWAALQAMHAQFDQVVPLSYPLTPHVTLAYFKPGFYDEWTRNTLNAFFARSAQLSRQICLSTANLHYCRFESMAAYDVRYRNTKA